MSKIQITIDTVSQIITANVDGEEFSDITDVCACKYSSLIGGKSSMTVNVSQNDVVHKGVNKPIVLFDSGESKAQVDIMKMLSPNRDRYNG